MENSNLVSALRSLQASSAEMTKKQEEEDVKKQRYEYEMEDSLHAISEYSEKKKEIEMEIDSQEKVLRQPVATIGIEVIKNKSAEMDSLLRIACAESKVVYRCLEAEVEAVEGLKKELDEKVAMSEKAAAIEEREAESNKKDFYAAMADFEEAKSLKTSSEHRLDSTRKTAKELIQEVKTLKEKQQKLIASTSEAHRSTLANQARVEVLAKQLKEREERHKLLMKELQ
jgi:hypothetical protein